MPGVPFWRRYLRFWRSDIPADIDAELQFHLGERVEELLACVRPPMTREAALAQARAELGDERALRTRLMAIDERIRARRHTHAWRDRLRQDLRQALRGYRRSPKFTVLALGTLALGIGASTAMYSVIDGLLLNPLPYRAADRVVTLWRSDPKSAISTSDTPDEWATQAHAFEAIVSYRTLAATMTGHGEPLLLSAAAVPSSFAGFVGNVRFLLGRNFDEGESRAGGAPVVILGERLWRERFGGSDDVLEQHVVLDDSASYAIVGVVSDALRLPTTTGDQQPDIWLPLTPDRAAMGTSTIGRLRPSVSIPVAERELDSITAHLDPGSIWRQNNRYSAMLVRASDNVNYRQSLYLLTVAVALLLLIACANVSHLLLARGAAREREIAIRLAIGATRGRVIRQLVTENALLAIGAGILGIGVAMLSLQALIALRPVQLTQLSTVHLDGTAVAVAFGLSAFAGMVFGTTAALLTIRRGPGATLNGTAPSGGGACRTHRMRDVLVVSEMALSAMLLVGASLLVRTVINIDRLAPGFDLAKLVTAHVDLPKADASEHVDYASRLVAAARAVPGVLSATVASEAPPKVGVAFGSLRAENGAEMAATAPDVPVILTDRVTSDFFATLGISLIVGHSFDDGSAARKEVIVGQATAQHLWPAVTAVGQRLTVVRGDSRAGVGGGAPSWLTVVGVVPEVANTMWMASHPLPTVYYPFTGGTARVALVVRSHPGVDITAPLRGVFLTLQPSHAPPPITSVAHDISGLHAAQQFTMTLLIIFAGLALLLAAVGLYGVTSYMVAQRTREIGVRMALGAAPRHIGGAVVVRGLALASGGLAIGLVGAFWGTRLIRSSLFGVQPTDPLSYAVGGVALLTIAIAACVVPTRRAMAVDPLIAMRTE